MPRVRREARRSCPHDRERGLLLSDAKLVVYMLPSIDVTQHSRHATGSSRYWPQCGDAWYHAYSAGFDRYGHPFSLTTPTSAVESRASSLLPGPATRRFLFVALTQEVRQRPKFSMKFSRGDISTQSAVVIQVSVRVAC